MSESTEIIETNNSNNPDNPNNITTNPHHIAIENPDNICFNYLQSFPQLHEILIPALNHGSEFTNFSSRLKLCNNCLSLTNPNWWKLEIIKSYSEYNMMQLNYKYEKEILDFINKMPLSGQELFYARFGQGIRSDLMKGQDWIDYTLGILPHEKCKEYGYYSPQEIQAYQERFPICEHPANRICSEESKNSWCPFGAIGEYNQKCYDKGKDDKCYECEYFQERINPIRDIMECDWKDYEVYYKSKINAEKYKEMFEKGENK